MGQCIVKSLWKRVTDRMSLGICVIEPQNITSPAQNQDSAGIRFALRNGFEYSSDVRRLFHINSGRVFGCVHRALRDRVRGKEVGWRAFAGYAVPGRIVPRCIVAGLHPPRLGDASHRSGGKAVHDTPLLIVTILTQFTGCVGTGTPLPRCFSISDFSQKSQQNW